MKSKIAREIFEQSSGDLKADVKLYRERLVEEYNKRIHKDAFIDFLEIVRKSLIGNDLRLGQQIWNEGVQLYPDLFEQYRATKYDPFHRNAAINDLFEQILDKEALAHWQSTPLYLRLLEKLSQV